MKTLNATTDQAKRTELLAEAQKMIAADNVNGFLFQLASLSVANAKIIGMWENSPTQAVDLTAVYWK